MSITIPYRNIIVFDTETTGLIPKAKDLSIENCPYITQLSFAVYDTQLETIRSSFDTYIKIPTHVIIPEIVTNITGITKEKCQTDGIPIKEALQIFYHAMSLCDCIIGHNIEFDIQMINIEVQRNRRSLPKQIHSIFDPNRLLKFGIHMDCTMRMTIDACSLYRTTDKKYTYKKFPKLSETYFHIFQIIPENLHNSMIDVLICLRCYIKYRFDITIEDDKFDKLIENAL